MIRIRKLTCALTIVLACISIEMLAQNEIQLNCTQTLRTARAYYDQGRLHELPTLLNGCLMKSEDNEGFTDAERIEAYKILTLSYIYLEEPAEADKAMTSLLHTDHFFVLNEDVDPVEFKNLYRKFRTEPVFRVGFKIGGNLNHINVIANHYMWGASQAKGSYSSNIGFQGALIFEKDIKERITLNPELAFSIYSFNYANDSPLSPGSDPTSIKQGKLEHKIAQQRLTANILVQYRLKKPVNIADKFIPYIAAGPSIGYLTGSTFSGNTDVDEGVTATAIPTLSDYKPLAISFTVMAGAKLRIGGFYLTGDVRFNYGFMNVVNGEDRYRWTDEDARLLDFGYVDNDFSLSQSMVNIGLILPIFSPIKLIR